MAGSLLTRLREIKYPARDSDSIHQSRRLSLQTEGIQMSMFNVAPDQIDQIVGATKLSKAEIARQLRQAFTVSSNVLDLTIRGVTASRWFDNVYKKRWFGSAKNSNIIENLVAMRTRINAGKPLDIVFTSEDVWGKGGEGQATMSLGRKFFNEEYTKPTSDLACNFVTNDGEISKTRKILRDYDLISKELGELNALEDALVENEKPKLKGYDPRIDKVKDFCDGYLAGMPPAQKFRKTQVVDSFRRGLGIGADADPKEFLKGIQTMQKIVKKEKAGIVKSQGRLSESQMTGFGVVIHELSHIVVGTKDLLATTAGCENDSTKCYGLLLCQMLAEHSPADALKNADNYRLLAECFGPK